MPIVFVHGVANRNGTEAYDDHWANLEAFLREYIAPEISEQPDQVKIIDAYWGDLGVRFAWDGISRPRSPLLGMGAPSEQTGADRAQIIATLPPSILDFIPSATPPARSGLVASGSATGITPDRGFRLKNLSPDQLSDFLVAVLDQMESGSERKIAADKIAHDSQFKTKLEQCNTLNEELDLIENSINVSSVGLTGMGFSDWLKKFLDRMSETVARAEGTGGFVLSRAVVEFRGPINNAVTTFLGDVFVYLNNRGNASKPGAIPKRVLDKLKDANDQKNAPDEPLIVLTHSMGGQIIYDLVTHFLPNLPEYGGIRIDFWCATASQVGLFEEMKLFCESSSKYSAKNNNTVPFPDLRFLRGWWNVWDYNDFISYTARGIIADVDDGSYNSGMSLLSAHSGYLERPSFYRQFAAKLCEAKSKKLS